MDSNHYFNQFYSQFLAGQFKTYAKNDLIPLPLGSPHCVDYRSLPPASPDLFSRVIVLKLNGGLGTTLGCNGPKSTIVVDSLRNQSFLDIVINHVLHARQQSSHSIPFWLFNSFFTDNDTRLAVGNRIDANYILQHQFPRIDVSNPDQPKLFHHPSNERLNWAPPGHGDLYTVLQDQNWIETQLQAGYDYLFVSNIDNVGATLDASILQFMINESIDFVMETTPKLACDVKGGSLILYHNRLHLVEVAQVAPEALQAFQQLPIFNTNNIWIHLPRLLNPIQTDLICNPKVIDGTPVIQLESAMGSAIQSFDRSTTVVVPRHRFMPVKTPQDLEKMRAHFSSKSTS